MKLVHLSDIHLTRAGERIDGRDPSRNFARCLDHVRREHGDADRVVVTGDLTHRGEAEAYHHLRDALRDFPLPVRLLIGNHDDRDTFLDCFPDHPRDENGFVNHAEEVGGARFLYLDTVGHRTHAGVFDRPRLGWLKAELKRSGDRPVFLFCHHHPAPVGIPAEDLIALREEDSGPFLDLLGRHRGTVRHLFFGHCHLTMGGTLAGIPFSAIRSTNHQSHADFRPGDLLKLADHSPHYAVALISPRDVVVHHVEFAYDGPVREAAVTWADRP